MSECPSSHSSTHPITVKVFPSPCLLWHCLDGIGYVAGSIVLYNHGEYGGRERREERSEERDERDESYPPPPPLSSSPLFLPFSLNGWYGSNRDRTSQSPQHIPPLLVPTYLSVPYRSTTVCPLHHHHHHGVRLRHTYIHTYIHTMLSCFSPSLGFSPFPFPFPPFDFSFFPSSLSMVGWMDGWMAEPSRRYFTYNDTYVHPAESTYLSCVFFFCNAQDPPSFPSLPASLPASATLFLPPSSSSSSSGHSFSLVVIGECVCV